MLMGLKQGSIVPHVNFMGGISTSVIATPFDGSSTVPWRSG